MRLVDGVYSPEEQQEPGHECSKIVVAVNVLRGHEANVAKHLAQHTAGHRGRVTRDTWPLSQLRRHDCGEWVSVMQISDCRQYICEVFLWFWSQKDYLENGELVNW